MIVIGCIDNNTWMELISLAQYLETNDSLVSAITFRKIEEKVLVSYSERIR